jgi:hypothetical protein
MKFVNEDDVEDGSTQPPRRQYVEDNQFTVAGIVAGVFKVAAVLVIAAGVIAIYELHQSTGVPESGRVQLAVAGGTVLLAASFAFFAYVLDMLRALVLDSRRNRPWTGSVRSPEEIDRILHPGPKEIPEMTTKTVPQGWYHDSGDPGNVRWWDGTRWTSLTKRTGAAAPPPSPSGI